MLLTWSATAHACADGPDYLDVTGVAANDTLNVRSGPGLDFRVIATLPPDAKKLQNLDRVPIYCDYPGDLNAFERQNFWTKVAWEFDTGFYRAGWVKSRFLQESSAE